nr:RNA-directed DNA polymerase, eukaryota [Tanacetum cinerariifolium]
MGDFNEVRRMEEWWGSVFNARGADVFNYFISGSGLTECQLEGYSFTWAHPSAKKMSKLDRFLMTNGLLASFPHISAISLDRHLSDHRLILLREVIKEIRAWIAIYNRNQNGHIEEIKSKLKNIDQMVDQGMVTDDI